MLSLGESEEEIIETLRDLRSVGVDIITMGQYLQPSFQHLPVRDYLSLERFSSLKEIAERVGFDYVSSGALVRSSYRAGEFFIEKIASKGVAHPNIKKV